ncbi:M36 family metallopeptidase [Hymenobacter sp. B81]|uniref:M36 family metallopeptidase n=1 Tax=Hymenobacter sp. B81 TaxID=3344878 RepID=UPI0037DD7ACB
MLHPIPLLRRPVLLVALMLGTLTATSQNRAAAPKPVPQAALEHLREHKQQLQVSDEDLSDLTVSSETRTAHNGMRHLYLQQRYRGIPIHGAISTVNMQGEAKVVSVGNRFYRGIARKANKPLRVMDAKQAVAAAARHLNLSLRETLQASVSSGDAERFTRFGTGGIALEPITARLVYQPRSDGSLLLAWEVFIYKLDALNAWNIRLDASSGEVLDQDDLVTHCEFDVAESVGAFAGYKQLLAPRTAAPLVPYAAPADNAYNVFALPAESPSHGPRNYVGATQADATASLYGWHDTNGAAGAEFTITRGNNVHAYEDPDNNNNSGGTNYSPNAGPGLLFDYPIDFAQQPVTYRDAATTNLFYMNNIMHDVWYRYGFDEASGNFQVNNYGRGGLGADDVRAEAQDDRNDPTTRNNANFFTPADGARPRMQMYLWTTSSGIELDGDLDNGIIAHEYGHGISNRLTGGPNVTGCLSNAEQGGEGWSDWFGLMLTMQAGDTGGKRRGIGTYALSQPTNGRGIRPAPYSTDMAINGYTYDDTNDPALSRPHGVGFVWATMLWDLNWALVDRYGFEPNVYAGTGGNNKAMQLIIDGLKLQPCGPGFVDARDAILAADNANYGGANQKLIWEVFARRGLGFSASQGSANSRFDQVEAFDLPPLYACVPPTITATPTAGAYTGGAPGTIFLGYGPQSIQLQASGVNISTYSWSPAAGLSNANIANPVFTPTAAGTYTFTVTATDVNSCVATAQVTITVLDVRCGNRNSKVLVCHKGNTQCIDAHAVAAHLSHGDKLGDCGVLAPSTRELPAAAGLTAAPNPAGARTTISFELPQDGNYRLEVVNMQGLVVAVIAEGSGRAGQVYQYEFAKGQLRKGLYLARLVTSKASKFTRIELQD